MADIANPTEHAPSSESVIGAKKKPTVIKSPREKAADKVYWAVRLFTIVNVIMMFFPTFNPAKISDQINKNLSLFTCGVSYSSLVTNLGRSFTRGWVPEAAFKLLNASCLIIIAAAVVLIVGGCMSLGNNKMKKTGSLVAAVGAVIELCSLFGIYRSYNMLTAPEVKAEKVNPVLPGMIWVYMAIAVLLLALSVLLIFMVPKLEAGEVMEIDRKSVV